VIPAAPPPIVRRWRRAALEKTTTSSAGAADQPRFLATKSQFTSFQNSSMYFGRAFR
jgi:hypothetical protein